MTRKDLPQDILDQIARGVVIPACPLALTSSRKFDERRQRALMRYYIDAGAGGIAVGMHFTQFEIRKPGVDLFEPVLRVCSEEIDRYSAEVGRPIVKVAGINGLTESALKQAELARELGYHVSIVSMASRYAFVGPLPPALLEGTTGAGASGRMNGTGISLPPRALSTTSSCASNGVRPPMSAVRSASLSDAPAAKRSSDAITIESAIGTQGRMRAGILIGTNVSGFE